MVKEINLDLPELLGKSETVTSPGASVQLPHNATSASVALVIDGNCQQTVGVWGTNLITNGDFSDGITGWGPDSVTNYYVSNNTLFFTPVAKYGGVSASLEYRFPSIAGHKYYVANEMKAIDTFASTHLMNFNGNGGHLYAVSVAADGIFHRKSAVLSCTTSSDSVRVKPQSTAESAWSEIAVRYLIVIDLTAAFGAGNEPTAEQMDAYLEQFPDSWFDGSALITTDGTPNSPSPDYPAPINAIEELTLRVSEESSPDYTDVPLPLNGEFIGSLPDGTHDELSVDAVGNAVLVKRCGKVVFDGSADESWYWATTPFVHYTVSLPLYSINTTKILLCDRYQTGNNAADGCYIASNGSNLYVREPTYGGTTVEEWRTWLAANPVTVYYKLAESYTVHLDYSLPPVEGGEEMSVDTSLPTEIVWRYERMLWFPFEEIALTLPDAVEEIALVLDE